jgi:eukaryotic-like serine/threonine-protein kinase
VIPSTRRRPVVAGQIVAEKYEVVRVVGEGGMGRVVEARHLDLGQNVALKIMHEDALGDADSVSRFLREARIAARLTNDHAVRIYDLGRLPSGAPYLVMELLAGDDLHALQKKRSLTVAEAVDFVLQASQALVEAHALGLVHRDVKPQNLFLADVHGGRTRVKVVDFGLAKDLAPLARSSSASALTTEHMILGSPNFMSPEQVRSPRNVDARTDIWALGATLFQLLAGRPPFEALTVHSLLARILTDAVPSIREFRPEVSPAVERAIARALEKDVDRRFPDMRSFAAALAESEIETAPTTERMPPLRTAQPSVVDATQAIPAPPQPSEPAQPALRTSSFVATLLVVVVVAGSAAIAIAIKVARGGSPASHHSAAGSAKQTAPPPDVSSPQPSVASDKPPPPVRAPVRSTPSSPARHRAADVDPYSR